MFIKRIFILLFILLSFSFDQLAQDDPYKIATYPFVRYDLNKFDILSEGQDYSNLFNKFNKLIVAGEGNINIVQIGDSHIQADYLSGKARQRFQTFFQGGTGGRGFIFPYAMANTNNPVNYKIHYKGNWESCRNVEKNTTCNIGLSGITAITKDSTSSVTIKLLNKEWPAYDFNTVKIFHRTGTESFRIQAIYPNTIESVETNLEKGYTTLNFASYSDSVVIKFVKTENEQNLFELYGFSLENQDPGVLYHAIGVNGAETSSYLRCNLFEKHLSALNPDWIIISLGTNDAYPKTFNADTFYNSYDQLIMKVKNACENIPLLLTVPGDSYRFRIYPNEDTEKVREVIYQLAKKHHCAVWDFYHVMGGLNSIYLWHKAGLAGKDNLHFTKEGYWFQGDLLFNAFLKKYDEFIDANNQNIKNE